MNIDIRKIFDLGHIFSTPDDIFGPYSTVLFIIFAVGAVVSNLFYFWLKYRFKSNLLTYTIINRASKNGSIAFTLGFVFFLSRIARLQPFNARIFLYIAVALLVFFTVRGIGYLIRTYPKAKAEWLALQEKDKRKARPEIKATPAPVMKLNKAATLATADAGSSTDDAAEDGDESDSAEDAQSLAARVARSERAMKRRERKRRSR